MKQREATKSILFNVGKEMWRVYTCPEGEDIGDHYEAANQGSDHLDEYDQTMFEDAVRNFLLFL